MERKNLTLELKADEEGSFRAAFSFFDVIDKDGDVTRKDAFKSGAPVRIAQWGHNWGAPPVGRGILSSDDSKAWVDGQFFLDVTVGADTYRTVKNLGELQEWSYGFNVLKSSHGQFEGKEVRFLEEVEVFEVSPVMIGAGIGTHTEFMKSAKTFEERNAAIAVLIKEHNAYVEHYFDMRSEKGRSLSAGARESLKLYSDAAAGAGPACAPALLKADESAFDLEHELLRSEVLRARRLLGVAS